MTLLFSHPTSPSTRFHTLSLFHSPSCYIMSGSKLDRASWSKGVIVGSHTMLRILRTIAPWPYFLTSSALKFLPFGGLNSYFDSSQLPTQYSPWSGAVRSAGSSSTLFAIVEHNSEDIQGTCQDAMSAQCVGALVARAEKVDVMGLGSVQACEKLGRAFGETVDSACTAFADGNSWSGLSVKRE